MCVPGVGCVFIWSVVCVCFAYGRVFVCVPGVMCVFYTVRCVCVLFYSYIYISYCYLSVSSEFYCTGKVVENRMRKSLIGFG